MNEKYFSVECKINYSKNTQCPFEMLWCEVLINLNSFFILRILPIYMCAFGWFSIKLIDIPIEQKLSGSNFTSLFECNNEKKTMCKKVLLKQFFCFKLWKRILYICSTAFVSNWTFFLIYLVFRMQGNDD